MGVAYNNVLHTDIGAGAPSTQHTSLKQTKARDQNKQSKAIERSYCPLVFIMRNRQTCFAWHCTMEIEEALVTPISAALLPIAQRMALDMETRLFLKRLWFWIQIHSTLQRFYW